MDKNAIAQKAKQRHEEYQARVTYIDNTLSAGICPTCGKELKLKRTPYESTYRNVGWFFTKEVPVTREAVTVVCPKGHALIHPQWGDQSHPGSCIYEKCLNDEIRDYHGMNYGNGDSDGAC